MGKRRYADPKREVMTWDADRHMNEVRCITIGSGFYVYKTLDTPTRDILVYKPLDTTARREYNELRKSVKNRSGKISYRAADLIGRFRDSNRDNSNLSGRKQRGANNYDKFDSESVERKGNSDGGRTPENVRNDQLQEGLIMVTRNMFKTYVDISCKILHMYSHDTIIQILDFMSSDDAVLKMEEMLSTNPSESELLIMLDVLRENEPK